MLMTLRLSGVARGAHSKVDMCTVKVVGRLASQGRGGGYEA